MDIIVSMALAIMVSMIYIHQLRFTVAGRSVVLFSCAILFFYMQVFVSLDHDTCQEIDKKMST